MKSLKEILFVLLQVSFGEPITKIGLGLFLLIVGIAILASPVTEDMKPFTQYLIGFLLVSFAIFLYIWKFNQMNNEKKK